jgi:hypothetical protein
MSRTRTPGRTRSITAHVTPDEEEQVKEIAARLNIDVSTFAYRALKHELSDAPLDPAEAMLELFVRTMEASLELGDGFTAKRFRQLCAEVKTHCSARPVATAKTEAKANAQT